MICTGIEHKIGEKKGNNECVACESAMCSVVNEGVVGVVMMVDDGGGGVSS